MCFEDIMTEILEKAKYLAMGISVVPATYVIYKFTETKIKNPDISISNIIPYTLKTAKRHIFSFNIFTLSRI